MSQNFLQLWAQSLLSKLHLLTEGGVYSKPNSSAILRAAASEGRGCHSIFPIHKAFLLQGAGYFLSLKPHSQSSPWQGRWLDMGVSNGFVWKPFKREQKCQHDPCWVEKMVSGNELERREWEILIDNLPGMTEVPCLCPKAYEGPPEWSLPLFAEFSPKMRLFKNVWGHSVSVQLIGFSLANLFFFLISRGKI